MNYPIVTVSRDPDNPDQIYVMQERFLEDPNSEDPEKYKSPYG